VSLRFKNLTNKTIVGLRGHVAVLDGFGKTVYSFGFRDDDKIAPNSEAGRGAYNFDHNQFEDDDPYSKMFPLIEAGTAKYQTTVTNIAFADGSVLPTK
jgi:prepilin-type processing-associated H-X9-DG protein